MQYYIPLFTAAPPSPVSSEGCGTGCIAGINVAIVVVLLAVVIMANVTVCVSAKRSKYSLDNKNSTKESAPVEMADYKSSDKV